MFTVHRSSQASSCHWLRSLMRPRFGPALTRSQPPLGLPSKKNISHTSRQQGGLEENSTARMPVGVLNKVLFMADSFAAACSTPHTSWFTGGAVEWLWATCEWRGCGEGAGESESRRAREGSDAIYKRQRLFKESVLCDCGKSNCPPA